MRQNVLRVFVFSSIFLFVISAHTVGQCLVVTPKGSGSGTGTDWNNAISAANLTSRVARGNIYYLSGGSYNFADGTQTFNTADSGTQTITIRAATVTDHGVGSGCGTAGWSVPMGASGSNQVVFRCSNCTSNAFKAHINISTDYWIFDGNDPTRIKVSDSSSDYNMAIDNSWHGGASDGSALGFNVYLFGSVHDVTFQYIEYMGAGLDGFNADPQKIATISCAANVATITLAGQRNHPYLFVGEWVTIGGTASHAKDTADTLSASPQQVGGTTNGQITSCTNVVGSTAVCTLTYAYVPVISTDGSQNVIIAGNSVANYNGTWPVTGVNIAAHTLSATIGTSGNGTGTGGNATWNGSVGVQIQSVTTGAAVCAPGVTCSNDWTQPFTVSGNGYTCSGGAETTGVLAGPNSRGGAGNDVALGSNSNINFLYDYGHDNVGMWDLGKASNISVIGSACERTYSHTISPFHSSCLADSGTNGLTFAYNRVLDTEGTGDVGALSRGVNLTSQNWNIYGNVFGLSDGNAYKRNGAGGGDGQVFCINVITCTNWNIFNNTIVGDGGTPITHYGFVAGGGPTVTNVICENNLAFQATQSAGTFFTNLCSTEDYNSYFNLGANQPTSFGPHSLATNSLANPFTNSLIHNYLMAAPTQTVGCTAGANCLQDGLNTHAFLTANDVDPNGTSRGAGLGWYRGAFQYVAPNLPGTPPGLTIKAVH